MSDDVYEVYAIKYGRHERNAPANFIGGDPHDVPMPLDYYVWAIVGATRTFVLDTGFDQKAAQKRDRTITKPVGEGLHVSGDGGAHHGRGPEGGRLTKALLQTFDPFHQIGSGSRSGSALQRHQALFEGGELIRGGP